MVFFHDNRDIEQLGVDQHLCAPKLHTLANSGHKLISANELPPDLLCAPIYPGSSTIQEKIRSFLFEANGQISTSALAVIVPNWLKHSPVFDRTDLQLLLELATGSGNPQILPFTKSPLVVAVKDNTRDSGEARVLKQITATCELGPEIDICSLAGMRPGQFGPAETIVQALYSLGIHRAFIGITPDNSSIFPVKWRILYDTGLPRLEAIPNS